jgi:uncharacterized protein
MSVFGADFKRARREWLYPIEVMQGPWRAGLFFILLFVVSAILQTVAGFIIYYAWYGAFAVNALSNANSGSSIWLPSDQELFVKASIVGLFPSAILILLIALFFARFGLPKRMGKLPLRMPQLGWLGWIVVVLGFGALMLGVFSGTFAALGIDPETYTPSGGGLGNDKSSAGIIEKTMASLAKDPILFAIALPSVVLAAPLTEEIMFRGALFSGIASSRLGRTGAVLITAALWALAHATGAPWLFVGVLFMMGIALGLLLLRFGSLWVTIACHASWNALSSLGLFGAGTH